MIPESGLGPQNSQWRRWVETSITNMRRGLVAFKADIANSFKAISSSLELLSRQVLQNRTYMISDADTYTFSPYPTVPPPPQDGGSVTFTSTGTQLLVNMSMSCTMTTAANSFYWVYTVKIPGVLTPVLIFDSPRATNSMYYYDTVGGGGFPIRSVDRAVSFLITVPSPGTYTITSQIQAYANASETATLQVTTGLVEIRNL